MRLCCLLDHATLPGGLPLAQTFSPTTGRLLAEYASQFGIDPLHAALVELEALELCLAPGQALLQRAVGRLRLLQTRKAQPPPLTSDAGAAAADTGAAAAAIPAGDAAAIRPRLNKAEDVRLHATLGGLRKHLHRVVRNLPELFTIAEHGNRAAVEAAVRLLDAVLSAQKLRAIEGGSGHKGAGHTSARHASATDGSATSESSTTPRRTRSGSLSRSRHHHSHHHHHHRSSHAPRSRHRSASTLSSASLAMSSILSDLLHDMVELQLLRRKAFLLGYDMPLLSDGDANDADPDRALAGSVKAVTLAGEQLQRLALLMASDVAEWARYLPAMMPQANVKRLCVRHTFDQLLSLVGRLCFLRLAENRGEAIDADLVQTAAFVRLLYHRWARFLPHDAELRWQNPFVSLALRWLDQAQHAAELELAAELAACREDYVSGLRARYHPLVRLTDTWLSSILVFGCALAGLFDAGGNQAGAQGPMSPSHSAAAAAPAAPMFPSSPSPRPTGAGSENADPQPASPPVSPVRGNADEEHHGASSAEEGPHETLHEEGAPSGPGRMSGAARQVVHHLHFVLHSLLRDAMLGLIRLDMPLVQLRKDVVSSLDADFVRRISQGDALPGVSALQVPGDQSWVVLDHPTHNSVMASTMEAAAPSEAHSWAKELPSAVMDGGSSPLLRDAAAEPPEPAASADASVAGKGGSAAPSSRGYVFVSSHMRKQATAQGQARGRGASSRDADVRRSNNSESGVHFASDEARSDGKSRSDRNRRQRGGDSAVDADFLASASESVRSSDSGRDPPGKGGKGGPGSLQSSGQASPVRSLRSVLASDGVDSRSRSERSSRNIKFGGMYVGDEGGWWGWWGVGVGKGTRGGEAARQCEKGEWGKMENSNRDGRGEPSPTTQRRSFSSLLTALLCSPHTRYGSTPTAAQNYILDSLAPLQQIPVSDIGCYRLNLLHALLALLPALHDDLAARLTGEPRRWRGKESMDMRLCWGFVECTRAATHSPERSTQAATRTCLRSPRHQVCRLFTGMKREMLPSSVRSVPQTSRCPSPLPSSFHFAVHHYLESLVQYHAGILLSCTVDWITAALPILLSRRAQETKLAMTQCLKPLT